MKHDFAPRSRKTKWIFVGAALTIAALVGCAMIARYVINCFVRSEKFNVALPHGMSLEGLRDQGAAIRYPDGRPAAPSVMLGDEHGSGHEVSHIAVARDLVFAVISDGESFVRGIRIDPSAWDVDVFPSLAETETALSAAAPGARLVTVEEFASPCW